MANENFINGGITEAPTKERKIIMIYYQIDTRVVFFWPRSTACGITNGGTQITLVRARSPNQWTTTGNSPPRLLTR